MAAGWVNIGTGVALSTSKTTINTGFTELSNCHLGATEPTNKTTGMLWADSSTTTLNIWDGAAWRVILPDYTAAAGGLAQLAVAVFTAVVSGVAATGNAHFPIASQINARTAVALTRIGTLAASDNRYVFVVPSSAKYGITDVYIASDTATSSSDGSNNYAFQVRNLTAGVDLIAVAKTTNGAEIAADTIYSLGVDQNNTKADLNGGDVIELQITMTGTPTSLASAEIAAVVLYTEALF